MLSLLSDNKNSLDTTYESTNAVDSGADTPCNRCYKIINRVYVHNLVVRVKKQYREGDVVCLEIFITDI